MSQESLTIVAAVLGDVKAEMPLPAPVVDFDPVKRSAQPASHPRMVSTVSHRDRVVARPRLLVDRERAPAPGVGLRQRLVERLQELAAALTHQERSSAG